MIAASQRQVPPRRKAYKSSWQTSGKRPPAALGKATVRCKTRSDLLLWGGAPRRNRTGDPILTMDRRPSAVLSRIFPAGMTPWMAQLWAQLHRAPQATTQPGGRQMPANQDPPRPPRQGAGELDQTGGRHITCIPRWASTLLPRGALRGLGHAQLAEDRQGGLPGGPSRCRVALRV